MRDFEAELEAHDLTSDPIASHYQFIAEINRHFHLGEPLRLTARRRWWDILMWRLAMEIELQSMQHAEPTRFPSDERLEMNEVHDSLSPVGWK